MAGGQFLSLYIQSVENATDKSVEALKAQGPRHLIPQKGFRDLTDECCLRLILLSSLIFCQRLIRPELVDDQL